MLFLLTMFAGYLVEPTFTECFSSGPFVLLQYLHFWSGPVFHGVINTSSSSKSVGFTVVLERFMYLKMHLPL